MKFPSLDESRSRHLQNCSVSMSLGLDKFSDISLEPNLLVSSFIVSTTFVLVSMFLWSRSRSRLWDSDPFSLDLGLVIETQTFSVSVSVSSLRLRPFQSRSRSRHWDSDLFSLGLGLDDPNLVSLIPDLTVTMGLFQSYISHICTKFCLYLTYISPISYQNQDHISFI